MAGTHLDADSHLFRTGFGLNCSRTCSLGYFARLVHMDAPISHFFFFEEPFGLRQWAPRSVGPYGVGRLPTPLMHAPVGHAYGHPKGVPIIGRDSFSFCRSSALRAPGSNGAP